ncbi:MAG: hypothetical protein EAX96_08235 [Candidatus Lokiarchaeota archaeon]|nr:hypothetical protein [Candidatus Lokiarchaeota archaeon]
MAIYNTTEPTLAPYGGYYSGGISCTNLTVFNLSIFSLYHMLYGPIGMAPNCSSKVGLTFTYWNGTADGNGTNITSIKKVFILDPTKYVIATSQVYTLFPTN